MKGKRIISGITALTFVFSLYGCSTSDDKETESSVADTSVSETETETEQHNDERMDSLMLLLSDLAKTMDEKEEDREQPKMYDGARFAFADIDSDGEDELLIDDGYRYVRIFEDGETPFDEAPAYLSYEIEFYKPNYVKVSDLHNTPSSEEIWPYHVEKYPDGEYIYSAYSINKENNTEYGNDAFIYLPENDTDNDGVIYYISTGDEESEFNPFTKEEYDETVEKNIPEKNKINVEFKDLNTENVNSIK